MAVVGGVAGYGVQLALGRQQAQADGEALVDEVAHVLQSIAQRRPTRVGERVGKRDDCGRQTAERGRVVELAVEVLVRLLQPGCRDVGDCGVVPPVKPVVLAPFAPVLRPPEKVWQLASAKR
jgi:hypothetical protein